VKLKVDGRIKLELRKKKNQKWWLQKSRIQIW